MHDSAQWRLGRPDRIEHSRQRRAVGNIGAVDANLRSSGLELLNPRFTARRLGSTTADERNGAATIRDEPTRCCETKSFEAAGDEVSSVLARPQRRRFAEP